MLTFILRILSLVRSWTPNEEMLSSSASFCSEYNQFSQLRSLTAILLSLIAVQCDETCNSDLLRTPSERSLAERIAFACAHKPTLSFCGAKIEPAATTAAPIIDYARESSVLTRQPINARRADSPLSQSEVNTRSESADGFSPQQKTAPATRSGDLRTSPKQRRVRWVFVPHSGPGGDSRFWEDLAKSARFPSERKERREFKEQEESREIRDQKESTEPLLIVPPEPYDIKRGAAPTRALQSRTFPVLPSDAAYGAGQVHAANGNPFSAFDSLTDEKGLAHRPRSRSPFTKPGLWEPNPDDPHSRDPANKWWYKPESVGVDWLNGQLQWGGHWAVPAAGVGGTNGQSTLHFPSIGTFLGIPDDYD
ncbi:hypothetical protein PRIPAC_82202 [Pristionchus pacificus]|nr:hypothetical protein PRIPAC_82202 [Pristionchus pacificus]